MAIHEVEEDKLDGDHEGEVPPIPQQIHDDQGKQEFSDLDTIKEADLSKDEESRANTSLRLETDLLNDEDGSFNEFMKRKETLLSNIETISKLRYHDEPDKLD